MRYFSFTGEYRINLENYFDVKIYNNKKHISKFPFIFYVFENDKMTKILSCNTFVSEEAAKEYYDLLIEYGRSEEELILDGCTISTESDDVDFYSDYTKAEFIEMLQQSMVQ